MESNFSIKTVVVGVTVVIEQVTVKNEKSVLGATAVVLSGGKKNNIVVLAYRQVSNIRRTLVGN